jgi:hypothetical protein
MFKGISIDLGGTEYVVPPLSLEKLEELEPQFQALATPSASLPERVQRLMPILLASFQRNYAEITEAQLRQLLDLPSLNLVVEAIMQANGLRSAPAGEAHPNTPTAGVSGIPTAAPVLE